MMSMRKIRASDLLRDPGMGDTGFEPVTPRV
jgi:hypothetical protein